MSSSKAVEKATSTSSNPAPLLFPHGNRYALQPYLPPPNNQSGRPHVTLTYAQSLDGMISLRWGVQTALSGPESKAMTHYLRSVHDAILIGSVTAYTDDPSLNCRFAESLEAGPVEYERQPIPVILDPARRFKPARSKIIALARAKKGKPPLWLVTKGWGSSKVDEDAVKEVGGEMIVIEDFTRGPQTTPRNSYTSIFMGWEAILQALSERGIRSVMVEGGARVINRLYSPENRGYVSSVIITNAPRYLGEGGTTICPKRTEEDKEAVAFKDVMWLPLGQDCVMAARIKSDIPEGGDQNENSEPAAKKMKTESAAS